MANSQFQYVRTFELPDAIPASNWIIIRLDGRGFSKFTTRHAFAKPNDRRCLALMNACATEILRNFTDVVVAYGQSDEYSFVLHEASTLFDRRSAKLATSVATLFTAEFCMLWSAYFPGVELTRPWPTFDGRCVAYPKRAVLRDYLSWRQADCHVNNLYNTTFWNMVLKGGRSQRGAEEELKGSLSKDKNELLWSEFGINYNNEDEMYKKGSVVYRELEEPALPAPVLNSYGESKQADPQSKTQQAKAKKRKQKARIVVEHTDIINNAFWDARPYLLGAGE